MTRALITAFEPFGGERVNASLAAVGLLPRRIGRMDIVTAQLPTSYARSIPALESAIAAANPVLVLCVGQAADRAGLCLERVAINVQDARIPDNDGAMPCDVAIVQNGPAAYFSGLPLRKAWAALQAAGLPAEISNSAGTFVCNHVFYGLMHLIARRRRPIAAGFLHVPGLRDDSLTANTGMAPAEVARGIAIVLECMDRV